jgi:hypothetical protein
LYQQILFNNEIRIAEVFFYIALSREEGDIGLALVSIFSKPDPALLKISVNTLWSCEYLGDEALEFINVKTIKSVVSMIPHTPNIQGSVSGERFFLVEKPGLDVALVAGMEDSICEDETLAEEAV